MADQLNGFDPDGNPVSIPAASVQQALKLGYRLETDEDRQKKALDDEYGEKAPMAAAAGALRGATFGISDDLLQGVGVRQKTLRGLKEANPDASLAGEVGGSLASALIPGAPGAQLGKLSGAAEKGVATLLGEGAVAKLAGKAASGAIEGAAAGVGQNISDQALGLQAENDPAAGEKFVASVGLSTLLGAGMGVAGGLAGMGTQKVGESALKSLEATDAQGAVEQMMRNRLMKSAGFIQKDLNKLSKGEQQQVANEINNTLLRTEDGKVQRLVEAGDNVQDFLGKAKAAKQQTGDAIGAFYDKLDETTNGGAFKYDRVLKRIDEELVQKVDPIEAQYLDGVISKELAAFKGQAEKGVPGSFKQAHQMRVTLDNTINWGSEKVNAELKQKMRRIFDEELKLQAEAVAGKEAVDTLKAANRRYGALATATDAAESAVNRAVGNRAVSLTDYIAGGIGAVASASTGNIAPLAMAAGGALLNKVGRERGSSVAYAALRKIAESGTVNSVFANLEKRVQSGVVEAASGTVTRVGLDTLSKRNSGPQQPPPSVMDVLSPAPTAKGQQRSPAQSYEALASLASNPDALTARLDAALGHLPPDASPELKANLSATVTRAVQFLSQVAPKAPGDSALKALDRPWKPTQGEQQRFARYARAASDPLSVFDDLKGGSITREAIEALQNVYPALTDDLRSRVTIALADKTKPLPYATRQTLKAFLGTPSTDKTRIAQLQSLYQQAEAHPPQQSPQGAHLNLASGFSTEAQRIAGRRT